MLHVMLALAVILMAGMAMQAHAESIPSPRDQWSSGVPLEQIRCETDKILMERNGMPACVREGTAIVLAGKGFTIVITEAGPEEISFVPETIRADSLPIYWDVEHPQKAKLIERSKSLIGGFAPGKRLLMEHGWSFIDLQGAAGNSEITLPFQANYTRIGYLPEGMVLKYITQIDDGKDHLRSCDGFAYNILPNFMEVNITEVGSSFLRKNNGIHIGVSNCDNTNTPPGAVAYSKQEAIALFKSAGNRAYMMTLEPSYKGVDYILVVGSTTKPVGGHALWFNNGLAYTILANYGTPDELERIIHGMIN